MKTVPLSFAVIDYVVEIYISGDMFFNQCVSHVIKLPKKLFHPVTMLRRTNRRKPN